MAHSKTLPPAAESELQELRNLIGLAAFATEARRVLSEIELVADGVPELGKKLSELVNTRHEWIEHNDCAALVSRDAYNRLDALLVTVEFR